MSTGQPTGTGQLVGEAFGEKHGSELLGGLPANLGVRLSCYWSEPGQVH